jgi:hypothetical protein
MMKKNRFFGLSLSALISLILLTANISYGQTLEPPPVGTVVSQVNLIPDLAVIKQVIPLYTIYARIARISTIVTVEVAIDSTGKVTSAKALSGHPWLKEASINAVRQWEFTPISTGNVDEKVIGIITFDYFFPEFREQLQKAESEFEKNPDSPKSLTEIARAYANNYKNDEAIRVYEKVIQLTPSYSDDIYRELARLYLLFRNDESYQMILEKGLKVFPVSISLLEDLGGEYKDEGKYSAAIELHQKALIIEPDSLRSLNQLVDIYETLLRFEESLNVLHRIIAIKSNDSLADEKEALAYYQKKVGFAYLQLGKFDKAEEYLKKSLSISDSSSSWECLADVYEQKGDIDAAVQARGKSAPVVYYGGQLKRINANLKLEPITTKKLKP